MANAAVQSFLDGRVTLHAGDCRDAVRELADASIDAAVMDPPYALVSIGKRFGKAGAAPAKQGTDGLYARASAGFMGQQWDTGETAFAVEFWAEVLRVLKPGGHLVAFSGTRTYHRMAVAIEDAGFEIRDQLGWAYGSGFPKSHSLQAIGRSELGTALKPAWEPIVLGRKPPAGTVAENVLAHGVGALNIGSCRIGGGVARHMPGDRGRPASQSIGSFAGRDSYVTSDGRWPANILHDGSDEVGAVLGAASRFFYSAKADADDRIGSKHPTVKPVDLMRWLCRLVTPPGGTILDAFAGTGTTGEAAFREGFSAILFEREAEFQADIARRMELVLAGPMTRKTQSVKARGSALPAGGLFTELTEAVE